MPHHFDCFLQGEHPPSAVIPSFLPGFVFVCACHGHPWLACMSSLQRVHPEGSQVLPLDFRISFERATTE